MSNLTTLVNTTSLMTTAMSNVTDMMTTNATDVCSDDAIICIEFIKGDYMQSLQLALIVIMMQLAIYCLVYPFYSKISSNYDIKTIKNMRTNMTDVTGALNSSRNPVLSDHFVGDTPKLLFKISAGIIAGIFFAIKLLLYLSFDFKEYNAAYKSLSFNEFVSAKSIIQLSVFTHDFIQISSIMKTVQFDSLLDSDSALILEHFITLIFIANIIASTVYICILWPLLLLYLYSYAIGLLVAVMVCFGICCVICALVIIAGIFYVIGYAFGFILTCGAQSRRHSLNFIVTFFTGLAGLILGYFMNAIVFCFMFLFLQGPPADSIIIDLNRGTTDFYIMVLWAAATGIGVLTVFISFVSTCFRYDDDDDDDPDTRGHRRVSTNADHELGVM